MLPRKAVELHTESFSKIFNKSALIVCRESLPTLLHSAIESRHSRYWERNMRITNDGNLFALKKGRNRNA